MKVRVHGYWTTNFDSIYLIKNLNFINYCNIRTKTLLSILVGKPNSYLNFQFTLFSLIGLHNIYVINVLNSTKYTFLKKLWVANTRKHFQSHYQR